MGYVGKETCAGCGRPGEIKARSTRYDICDDCRDLLNIGKVMAAKQSGEYIRFSRVRSFFKGWSFTIWKAKGRKESTTNEQQGPYVSDAFDKRIGDGHMAQALATLLEALDEGIADPIGVVYFPENDHRHQYHIKKEIGVALLGFLKTIYGWGNEIENDAFQEGKDLLTGLATGKHTVGYFDDKVAQQSQFYKQKKGAEMKSSEIQVGGTYNFVATDSLTRKYLEGTEFTVVEIKPVWRKTFKKSRKVKRFFNDAGVGARAEELEPIDEVAESCEDKVQPVDDLPF